MSVDFTTLDLSSWDLGSSQVLFSADSDFASLPLVDFNSKLSSNDTFVQPVFDTRSGSTEEEVQFVGWDEDKLWSKLDPVSLAALTADVKYSSEQEEWLRQFEEAYRQDAEQPEAPPQQLSADGETPQQPQQHQRHQRRQEYCSPTETIQEGDDNEANYETDDDDNDADGDEEEQQEQEEDRVEKERQILLAAAKEKPSREEFGKCVAHVYRAYVTQLTDGTMTHNDVAQILSAKFPLWRRKFTRDFMTKVYRGKILQKYIGAIRAPPKRTKASVTGKEFDCIRRDKEKRAQIKNFWLNSGESRDSLTPSKLAAAMGISRPVAHRLIKRFKAEEGDL